MICSPYFALIIVCATLIPEIHPLNCNHVPQEYWCFSMISAGLCDLTEHCAEYWKGWKTYEELRSITNPQSPPKTNDDVRSDPRLILHQSPSRKLSDEVLKTLHPVTSNMLNLKRWGLHFIIQPPDMQRVVDELMKKEKAEGDRLKTGHQVSDVNGTDDEPTDMIGQVKKWGFHLILQPNETQRVSEQLFRKMRGWTEDGPNIMNQNSSPIPGPGTSNATDEAAGHLNKSDGTEEEVDTTDLKKWGFYFVIKPTDFQKVSKTLLRKVSEWSLISSDESWPGPEEEPNEGTVEEPRRSQPDQTVTQRHQPGASDELTRSSSGLDQNFNGTDSQLDITDMFQKWGFRFSIESSSMSKVSEDFYEMNQWSKMPDPGTNTETVDEPNRSEQSMRRSNETSHTYNETEKEEGSMMEVLNKWGFHFVVQPRDVQKVSEEFLTAVNGWSANWMMNGTDELIHNRELGAILDNMSAKDAETIRRILRSPPEQPPPLPPSYPTHRAPFREMISTLCATKSNDEKCRDRIMSEYCKVLGQCDT